TVNGDGSVGGLVGINQGTMSNCHSTATVTGTATGGLIGQNSTGSLSNCYSTGNVSGWVNVGGLIGSNGGTVERCYAAGNVTSENGYAFYVNGKSDGSAFGDAATQVMLGLLPAMLHPGPHSAFVVGLGTGTTAGWLAEVPGLDRVDVAELEPGILNLARSYFAPVNRGVMAKPNVHVIVGDAREVLMTRGRLYDLIVSEPSNPYRAGISTLFTREFYESVKSRLEPGGMFAQWLQGYDIDSHAVRLIYATLAAEFPYVETWMTKSSDMLLIGHLEPPGYGLNQLRERVRQPPFAEALARVWYTRSVEGVLAHHLASPKVAQRLVQMDPTLNTDDRNLLEYGFARALVQESAFDNSQLLTMAMDMKADVPALLIDQVDRVRLQKERTLILAAEGVRFNFPWELQGDDRRRANAVAAFVEQRYGDVLTLWTEKADSLMEQMMLMESVAKAGTPDQLWPLLEPVRKDWPADASFAAAQAVARHGSPDDAVRYLREGFTALRTQIWCRNPSVEKALSLVSSLTAAKPENAALFLGLLREPFPAGRMEENRKGALVAICHHLPADQAAEVLAMFEPAPRWTRRFLGFRRDVYRRAGDPRTGQAERDLQDFLSHADLRLDDPAAVR
ncbi:MAG: fused MFS/spermidine synthase, partial [Proteobacteria bacterium]|nr:fused MFS/spermidine synthase [Pseudomonadota bacterium]